VTGTASCLYGTFSTYPKGSVLLNPAQPEVAAVKKALAMCVKGKGKGFPYSIPSVGPGADPAVQAVSPRMTVSHPPGGRLPLCHYFPPGLRLPPQPQSVTALWPVPSYTAWWQRHIGVNNLSKVVTQRHRAGFELVTCWSQAQMPYPLHHRATRYVCTVALIKWPVRFDLRDVRFFTGHLVGNVLDCWGSFCQSHCWSVYN